MTAYNTEPEGKAGATNPLHAQEEGQKKRFPFSVWQHLTQDEAASTIVRLFRSQHVADLQLIFLGNWLLVILGLVLIFVWHWGDSSSTFVDPKALVTAIVGAGFGVSVWCYQTGSARLGVVDLFACEIVTLCTTTTVVEAARHFVELHENPPVHSQKFNSEEQYTPVFNNNSKDLEVLEARVVEPVTQFYTYLKTTRDYLRLLGDIENPQGENERWRNGMRNVIYMLFLMLESARNSVHRLVEYEPERAQYTIIVLLSELVAYAFLLLYYKKEELECKKEGRIYYNARLQRLRLRVQDYKGIVPYISDRTRSFKTRNDKEGEAWQPAVALLDELDQRYLEASRTWIEPPLS